MSEQLTDKIHVASTQVLVDAIIVQPQFQNTAVDAILTRTKRGPYNKISKMQRLQRVKELYFDKQYSIIDIANTLGINRNTVSSDVEFWRKEYVKFGGEDEITDFYYQKKSMFAIQRKRLEEKIKTDPTNQHRFEKLLMDLIEKEFKLISKFRPDSKNIDISPQLVKKIIRELAFSEFSFFVEGDLIRKIIEIIKCNVSTAKSIVDKMRKLGLDYTRGFGEDSTYMIKFAKICGCISSEEACEIRHKRIQKEKKEEQEYQKRRSVYREYFIENFGEDENWSSDIWKLYKSETRRLE